MLNQLVLNHMTCGGGGGGGCEFIETTYASNMSDHEYFDTNMMLMVINCVIFLKCTWLRSDSVGETLMSPSEEVWVCRACKIL